MPKNPQFYKVCKTEVLGGGGGGGKQHIQKKIILPSRPVYKPQLVEKVPAGQRQLGRQVLLYSRARSSPARAAVNGNAAAFPFRPLPPPLLLVFLLCRGGGLFFPTTRSSAAPLLLPPPLLPLQIKGVVGLGLGSDPRSLAYVAVV